MADTGKTAAGLEKAAAGPSAQKSRPDFATFGGLAIALVGILGGLILEKGEISDVAQGTAALIVLGGTFGAVLVSTPFPIAMRAFRKIGSVLFTSRQAPRDLSETFIRLAGAARKEGLASLEKEVATIADPFVRKGMMLAVDGADLQEIRNILDIEIGVMEQAAESEVKVWEAAGGFAPTVGIIGAVMGLIQVMKHLEDLKAVGHGIAVAFVATVYGVAAANLLFLPAAGKLRAHLRQATMIREMAIEGIAAIVQGLNPTLIRLKLESYCAGEAVSKTLKKPAGGAAPAEAGRAAGSPAAAS
jgi:chemotaxis protein MotA